MKGDVAKAKRRSKQERLLRLFDGDGYEEFHTPKYVFVKHWNGDNGTWQVAIYPIASWHRVQEAKRNYDHLRSIRNEM